MRKLSKTLLSLLLIAAMLASFVVLPAAAEEPAAEQPTEAVQAAETQAAETQADDAVKTNYELSIVMLDCGRKYFSVDSIKQIIDNASAAGFGYIMLGVGNDGMRFLLDDMSLAVNGTTYSSEKVAAAIKVGNKAYDASQTSYSYAPTTDELTQSEMDAVLAYAKEKGMGVIPMLNTPGHMDAILAAATSLTGTNCAYSGSARTIDVTNSTAVAFTQAFVQKYVDYFASKGCKYFNMGADEYANDMFTGGSMGFGNLQSTGKYSYYVEYVNAVAALIKNAGMTPMAFNDGIYFANNTSSGTFDTDIVICYWSNGWGGYTPMSAEALASKGFKMVNTHGDYYWVLGKSDWQCNAKKASGFNYKTFQGGTIDNPSGAMFCIWADYPGAETEASVISKTADTIAAFGATLPKIDDNKTVSDEATGVSVTAPGLTGITVAAVDKGTELDGKKVAGAWNIELTTENGSYTGSAAVKVPLDGNWTGCTITAGVMNENGGIDYGKDYDIKDGFLTFTAPHFSTVVVLAEPQQKSLVVPTNGTKTVEENGDLTGYTPEYSKNGIVKLDMSYASNVTTMTFTGLANGDVSVTVGNLVYQITVTNESYSSKKTITVAVGGTVPDTVDGEVSSTYTDDFVSVKTETKNTTATPYYERAALDEGEFYLSNNANDTAPSVKVTLAAMDNGQYSVYSSTYYRYLKGTYRTIMGFGWWSLDVAKSTSQVGLTISESAKGAVVISQKVTNSGQQTTAYLTLSGSDFAASETETTLYLYKYVKPTASKQTTISFTGKQVGTTQVVIGDVLYTIVVEDKAPDGAMTNTSLTLEYWITNSMVYDGTSTSTNHTKSITTTTTGANTDEGIAIEGIAPSPAYTFFDGRVTVYYWQAMRLDKDNKQTDTSGDDETADGTTFTHVRYHAGAWQYKTLDGTWHYFLSTDQAVAYYLQKTEVTKEVETYVKDWGYGTAGTTPNTSSGKGQVALTVAVVYPDGTVSPAERDMYSKSTTIFNYWDGRDIGIIAPKNNEDYTISKITVTDGNRKSNSTENVWYTSDTITWEKTTLDDEVTEWYNEREVWNKSSGTTPMVNGKSSKETWSAKNTAKLVLIYLEAAEKESNLNVVYYDDTYSKEIISSQIVMSYTQGQEPPTYLNSLQNNGTVTPGTITLADEAYVTNSSGVNQTFNKNVATVPGVAAQYRSGLYKYVSAEISEDGKTLTLHYKISANNLKKYYVVDFGLPVQFELTDLVDDTNLRKVRISTVTDGNVTYDETTKTFTYTPTGVLKSLATASIAISYTGAQEAILTVGFIPASTVYYEEGFASYSANWVSEGTAHGARQAKESYGQATNSYGFDPAYRENSANSEGTVARTTTVGSDATFKFNGTGLELYLRTKNTSVNAEDVTNHSYMLVQVYAGDTADANNLKRMSFVDVNNLFVAKDTGYGYNTPCWTVDDMALNDYTVVVRFVKGQELAIDGFRVTGTQGDRYKNAYAADGEANMQTAEIRNMVIANAQTNLNFDAYSNANEMYRVTANKVLDAVFDESDVLTGAVVLTNDDTMGVNTVTVDADLLNIGPKNEIYLQPGQAVVMQLTGNYASVQVGMRSLTGEAVSYKINGTSATMNSTVDMYYKVVPVEGKLVIQNVSGGILALTRLKVTSATAATTNDPGVVPQTTPEAIRYAMALMRGIDVPQFTDVAEDAWYHDYVYDLVYRGVVNGMTATTYEPEGKLTRAQFVKLLACSLEEAETLKTYEGQHPFTDSEGHWAEAYIAWAKDKGIVEGVSATEFDPEAPITREQMATIFGRYALKQGIELPKSDNAAGSFPDADKISEYAREFVELMRIAGILNGYEDGTFRPQGNATRAEAAKLFSLFLSITDKLAK
ncbi:MAG: S-layer homology domain-containing protein [Oscillospiraceae bacterium]